jgi:hypothetical protein
MCHLWLAGLLRQPPILGRKDHQRVNRHGRCLRCDGHAVRDWRSARRASQFRKYVSDAGFRDSRIARFTERDYFEIRIDSDLKMSIA